MIRNRLHSLETLAAGAVPGGPPGAGGSETVPSVQCRRLLRLGAGPEERQNSPCQVLLPRNAEERRGLNAQAA